jgi:hypothetical protein
MLKVHKGLHCLELRVILRHHKCLTLNQVKLIISLSRPQVKDEERGLVKTALSHSHKIVVHNVNANELARKEAFLGNSYQGLLQAFAGLALFHLLLELFLDLYDLLLILNNDRGRCLSGGDGGFLSSPSLGAHATHID